MAFSYWVIWYDPVFTDTKGFIRIGGDVAGGHCVEVPGYSRKENLSTLEIVGTMGKPQVEGFGKKRDGKTII
jgi:hypothetical protein